GRAFRAAARPRRMRTASPRRRSSSRRTATDALLPRRGELLAPLGGVGRSRLTPSAPEQSAGAFVFPASAGHAAARHTTPKVSAASVPEVRKLLTARPAGISLVVRPS